MSKTSYFMIFLPITAFVSAFLAVALEDVGAVLVTGVMGFPGPWFFVFGFLAIACVVLFIILSIVLIARALLRKI